MAGLAVVAAARCGSATSPWRILLLRGLYAPLGMLGFNYREIRQAFIDMEQMVELRGHRAGHRRRARRRGPAAGQRAGGRLAFEHVGFQHDARSVGPAATSASRAAPGTTTALVGPSGAGKTTVVRLAMRLIDPRRAAC